MPDKPQNISPEVDRKQAGLLFAGAIALVLLCVSIVGLDYSETRKRAADVPLNTQRIANVESAMKNAAKDQADATKELAAAVSDLRETIAEMRGRQTIK